MTDKMTGIMLGMLFLCGMMLVGAHVAKANPSYFAVGVSTNNAATTTPAYMTPGTATSTTPTFDAYARTVAGGNTYKADQAGVLTVFCGSSTSSVLNTSVEYSQDGIDWFRNYVLDPMQLSTTSSPYLIASAYSQQWKFASSSLGGAAGVNTCSTAATVIPTPFRYTRIVHSITGANGSVWSQLVPLKQQN